MSEKERVYKHASKRANQMEAMPLRGDGGKEMVHAERRAVHPLPACLGAEDRTPSTTIRSWDTVNMPWSWRVSFTTTTYYTCC